MLCNLNFPAIIVVAVGVVVAVVVAAVGLVELSTALVRYKLERPHNYRGHNFLPEFLDLNNYALWISEIVEKAYHSHVDKFKCPQIIFQAMSHQNGVGTYKTK